MKQVHKANLAKMASLVLLLTTIRIPSLLKKIPSLSHRRKKKNPSHRKVEVNHNLLQAKKISLPKVKTSPSLPKVKISPSLILLSQARRVR